MLLVVLKLFKRKTIWNKGKQRSNGYFEIIQVGGLNFHSSALATAL